MMLNWLSCNSVMQNCESNMSLPTLVTLDLTSLLPWPLKGDDIHRKQSTKMKHYKTQQSTGKMRSGLTLPMLSEQAKNKCNWCM